MRTLHDTLNEQGFSVLGFPCNQFGAQEPGTDAEIAEFVETNFGVTFPMFSKIEVNGDGACDLYQFLTSSMPKEDGDGTIVWNFTKFLVGRDGTVLKRFEPMVSPEEIGTAVADLL